MSRISQVGIVGCGSMGSQIAEWCIRKKTPLVVFDVASDRAQQLSERLSEITPTIECRFTNELGGLNACDLIIESVLEDANAKSQLFLELESTIDNRAAIFASNTSTIKIAEIASKLENPSRLLGTHFFHPVANRSLVEVIRSDATDAGSVECVLKFLGAIDKEPIVVNDTPGFIVNRLLFPYFAEAMQLLQGGFAISEIDREAREYGMPWGPFELADEIGLDVAYFSAKSLFLELGNRAAMSPILPRLVKKKAFGKKSRSGFYEYDSQSQKMNESALANEIISKYSEPSPPKGGSASSGSLMERMLLAVLVEASLLLGSQIVESVETIDLALVEGLDFPKSPHGIFGWAESFGAEKVLTRLELLSDLGDRFRPTKWLIDKATTGTFF